MSKRKIYLALALAVLFSALGQTYVAKADWMCGIEHQVSVTPAKCDGGMTCGNYPPQVVITNKAFYRQTQIYEQTCVNAQNEIDIRKRHVEVVLGCCD